MLRVCVLGGIVSMMNKSSKYDLDTLAQNNLKITLAASPGWLLFALSVSCLLAAVQVPHKASSGL